MSLFSSWIRKKTGIPEVNLQGDALVEALVSSILKMPVGDIQKLRVAIDKAIDNNKPV